MGGVYAYVLFFKWIKTNKFVYLNKKNIAQMRVCVPYKNWNKFQTASEKMYKFAPVENG